MPEYRRLLEPGGTYFFTVITAGRWPLFSNPAARSLLGRVFREVGRSHPFETRAIVLLPDHLHCLWTLPRGDDDFSRRWKRIKRDFTVEWLGSGGQQRIITSSQRDRGTRGVWQRRFWEHCIRDDRDFETHLDYIHYNPVKHGYVTRPGDWPWSSFQKHVQSGQYDPEWGKTAPKRLRGWDLE